MALLWMITHEISKMVSNQETLFCIYIIHVTKNVLIASVAHFICIIITTWFQWKMIDYDTEVLPMSHFMLLKLSLDDYI